MNRSSLAFADCPSRLPRLACIAVLLALILASPPASAYRLTIRVQDQNGTLIPARLHLINPYGTYLPTGPDSLLLSHYDSWMSTFFYSNGPVTFNVARGVSHIAAERGFEWRPAWIDFYVFRDTTATITLAHPYDLRQEGWYAGDNHVHSNHDPTDYRITPAIMHRVAQAEDLSMCWVLDQFSNFIGAPDPVSTPDAVLYYSTEWRNQAYGHVALLGLDQWLGQECCTPPWDAYPMLSDIREEWNPSWGQAMSLNHPHSTTDFMMDTDWPGWGLGREVPVMAATGNLDSYDIASYGDAGYVWVEDWYTLLNCGAHTPASAGTDCRVDSYFSPPPGGYRVYVKETTSHDPAHWVEQLKAGRTFVTNYPLIPVFTVDGEEAGSTLDRSGSSATVSVHMKVESTLPVSTAELIENGQVVAAFPLPGGPSGTEWETTLPVTLHQSSWLALRVDGTTTWPQAVSSALFAHSGAVFVRLNNLPQESAPDAQRLLDWIDSLQVFVDHRDHWEGNARHEVHHRLDIARDVFSHIYHMAPSAVSLLTPAQGESVSNAQPATFDWTDATDPEPGDQVHYRLELTTDGSFSDPYAVDNLPTSTCTLDGLPVGGGHIYWWRVWSIDRSGNHTCSPPPSRWFYYDSPGSTGVIDPQASGGRPAVEARPARLSIWPNPSAGRFHLSWETPAGASECVEIIGAAGRLIRRLTPELGPPAGPGAASASSAVLLQREVFWDGTDASGRAAAAGVYWARLRRAGSTSAGRGVREASSPLVLLRGVN